MQRCFATVCMCYAPHADSTSSVRESAAPSCSMHHLHMPCTRSLLHPALALRFSFASAASWFHCSRWVWVFRHCFVTVWQDVQTLPQCPSSAGVFLPNASLPPLWTKAFATSRCPQIHCPQGIRTRNCWATRCQTCAWPALCHDGLRQRCVTAFRVSMHGEI